MLKQVIKSFTNIFTTPQTISYPFGASQIDKNYRGVILYEEEKCIYCLQCETVCPPGAILFNQNIENGEYKYLYNPYLCIYCSECIKACPDSAVALSQSTLPVKPYTAGINDEWFLIEKDVETNRAEYKKLKKAKKANEG
jgi:NADH-quinone oxidoreductase subunit I